MCPPEVHSAKVFGSFILVALEAGLRRVLFLFFV